MTITSTLSTLEKIFRRYNPERDSIPDGPDVTWADKELAEAVEELANRVKKLEERLKVLEADEMPENPGRVRYKVRSLYFDALLEEIKEWASAYDWSRRDPDIKIYQDEGRFVAVIELDYSDEFEYEFVGACPHGRTPE